jgi:UrcA family protein
MNKLTGVVGATAIIACVFAVSSALAADPEGQVRTQSIMYGDLNLATDAGVSRLYDRVHSAARLVCAGASERTMSAGPAKCSKDAQARAIEEVNVPALTAFAAAR